MAPIVDSSRKRRYRTRYPMGGEDKRTHCISARMNTEEVAVLDKLRSEFGMQRGEFLRCAGLNQLPQKSSIYPELSTHDRQVLSGAARNLNQLMKAVHQGNVSHIDLGFLNAFCDAVLDVRHLLTTGKTLREGDEEGEES